MNSAKADDCFAVKSEQKWLPTFVLADSYPIVLFNS